MSKGSLMAQTQVNNMPIMQETQLPSLGWEEPQKGMATTPVFLPAEFHGQRSPAGYSLLLLSHFSCVQLCVTPETAAHQAPPSLGFSRQEHWSGLPLPSPMQESEK